MFITYIFPSKSRPEQFFKALHNIIGLSESKDYEIICVLDANDFTMNNSEVNDRLFDYKNKNVLVFYGNSTGKINAINREIDKINPNTEIVILMSDDFVFTKPGYDLDIIKQYEGTFRGLLHMPDGRLDRRPLEKHSIEFLKWVGTTYWTQSNNGKWVRGIIQNDSKNVCENYTELYQLYMVELNKRLITFPIMHIEYLKRFNYIYHPAYKSVFADEEQMQVAKILGQYKYVDKQIFRHEHYRNGYGEPDALMLHNDSPAMYIKDREVFLERKMNNFGLTKTTATTW